MNAALDWLRQAVSVEANATEEVDRPAPPALMVVIDGGIRYDTSRWDTWARRHHVVSVLPWPQSMDLITTLSTFPVPPPFTLEKITLWSMLRSLPPPSTPVHMLCLTPDPAEEARYLIRCIQGLWLLSWGSLGEPYRPTPSRPFALPFSIRFGPDARFIPSPPTPEIIMAAWLWCVFRENVPTMETCRPRYELLQVLEAASMGRPIDTRGGDVLLLGTLDALVPEDERPLPDDLRYTLLQPKLPVKVAKPLIVRGLGAWRRYVREWIWPGAAPWHEHNIKDLFGHE